MKIHVKKIQKDVWATENVLYHQHVKGTVEECTNHWGQTLFPLLSKLTRNSTRKIEFQDGDLSQEIKEALLIQDESANLGKTQAPVFEDVISSTGRVIGIGIVTDIVKYFCYSNAVSTIFKHITAGNVS